MGKGKPDEDPGVMIFEISSSAKVNECLLPRLVSQLNQEGRTEELQQLEKLLKKKSK